MSLVGRLKRLYGTAAHSRSAPPRADEETAPRPSRVGRALDLLLIPFVVLTVVTRQKEVVNLNILMVCVSALYLARGVWWGRGPRLRLTPADFTVFVLACVEVVAYFASSYRANSFYYLAEVLFLTLFFLLVRFNLTQDYQRVAVFVLLSVWAGALSYDAILEVTRKYNYLRSIGFDDLTLFKQEFIFSTPRGLVFGEWATVYLALLPFPLILILEDRVPLWAKALLLLCAEAVVVAIILTLSRGMYVALMCFIAVGAALVYSQRLARLRSMVIFFGLAGAITLLVLIPFRRPVLTTASFFKTTSQVRSFEGRGAIWADSLGLFGEKPLLGAGAYNFPMRYLSVKDRADDSVFAASSFNFFLQVLVEKGAAGLAAYALFVLAFYFASFKALKRAQSRLQKSAVVLFVAAYSAVLVRDLSYSSILPNITLSLLLWFMFSLNARAAEAPRGDDSARQGRPPLGRRAVVPYALAFGSLILFACVAVGRERVRTADDLFQAFTRSLADGRTRDAQREIAEAVRLNPDNAHFLAYQAVLHTRMTRAASPEDILAGKAAYGEDDLKHIEAAVGLYRRALELSPDDDLFHHSLGWLHLMRGDKSSALAHLRRAAAIDNPNALYHVSLGLLYENMGDREGALEGYASAVRFSPGVLDSRFFADLRRRAPADAEKLIADATSHMEEETRKQPSPFTKGKLGYLYLVRGDVGGARELLSRAAAELPNLPGPWFNLGYVYELEGDEEKMHECYVKATFTGPGEVQPWVRLGDFYHRRHRPAEAISAYQRGLKNWLAQPSERVRRARRIYHSYPSLPLVNSVVPEALSSYHKPAFPVAATYLRLADSYEDVNDSAAAAHYTRKARELRPTQ